MSRIAKNPIAVPSGVEINLAANQLMVKGGKGELSMAINPAVEVKFEDGQLTFAPAGQAENGWAQAGTARAVANNLVRGVTEGFEKKLQLVGVGYRAQAQGKKLNLLLAPGGVRAAGRDHGRDAVADRDCHQGHRQAARGSGFCRDPRLPTTRALQGQGRALCGRVCPP